DGTLTVYNYGPNYPSPSGYIQVSENGRFVSYIKQQNGNSAGYLMLLDRQSVSQTPVQYSTGFSRGSFKISGVSNDGRFISFIHVDSATAFRANSNAYVYDTLSDTREAIIRDDVGDPVTTLYGSFVDMKMD